MKSIEELREEVREQEAIRGIQLARMAEVMEGGDVPPIVKCPDEDEIIQLLAGNAESEERRIGLFAHIRACELCLCCYEGMQKMAHRYGSLEAAQAQLESETNNFLVRLGLPTDLPPLKGNNAAYPNPG